MELWNDGTDAIDSAADLLAEDAEAARVKCETARRKLEVARWIARTIGHEKYPIEDELRRLEELEAFLSSGSLDPDAPLQSLREFDASISAGDSAFKDDDHQEAAAMYARAYEILESFVDDPLHPETIEEDTCRLCLQKQSTTTIRFRGESHLSCKQCESQVSGRFPSEKSVIQVMESIRTDVGDTLEWSPGPAWLSADTESDDESDTTGSQESDVNRVFLVREFTAVSQQIGRPARPEDIDKLSEYSPEEYTRAFGSWSDLVSQAGYGIGEDDLPGE